MNKLFSTAAVAAIALVAGSAFAGPNGAVFAADPSFDVAAKAGKLTRADVNAQAVQSQRDTREIYANADGATNSTAAAVPAARSREEVKAETIQSLHVSGIGSITTPY
jgi:hypothetical protein